MAASKSYRIGDLARELDMPVENIRYYERAGLMPAPRRSAGNYRVYGEAERERLVFIRHCRSLDMSLDEVRRLLKLRDTPSTSCADVDALLDAHIEHVTDRITELKRLGRALRQLRARCRAPDPGRKHCAILEGLAEASRPRRRPSSHVQKMHTE
jgi:Cd(II)/Pb(II)-responsive transcriptional regulator